MSESIGNLYSTLIPSLSETADIQEALRLYHYGAPSGTGTGQYDPTNSNPANLVNPSIAYSLNNLQSQITSISGSLGVQSTTWTTKGDLVTRTSSPGVVRFGVGADGTVLTANSSTATGLEWASLPVTLTNTVTLTNKTLNTPNITGLGVIFEGSTADDFETTLNVIDPTADRTISLPNVDGTVITTGNLTSITTVGTITAGTWNGSAIAANYGGTGQTSYTVGDIIYASGSTALSKLAGVATGNALISGGVGTAPLWGKIGLSTHISGTLPVANGGTGLTSVTTGDILYASASNTLAALTGVATGNVLISGGVSTAPSWGKVGLTTHISGTLAVANGGTGVTTSTGTGSVVLSASPTLTGTPIAPTATDGTNTTQIATTAYAYQLEDFIVIAISDETTNITTGTNKVRWRAPFAMTLTRIPRASLAVASTSGNPTVDINENGTSILGANKLSIDANEKTSVTAATPTTLADTAIADDSEIGFDIDVAGNGARGLKVTLYYKRA
jgi:hypothetical protein